MSQKPLVSVITTFLNAEKYFEESLESVLNQKYKTWELLLIDDGSSDKSTEIAINYCNKYPERVRYFEHEGHQNKGISASRNLGTRKSKGKYIATIDADDIWLPNKLEEQVEILESNTKAGMVYGDTKFWYSWSGKTEDTERDFYLHEKILNQAIKLNTVIYPPTLLILALESKIWVASMSNIMMRKEVVERIGGFVESFSGMHEDQAFLTKSCLTTPLYVADTCWDLYRQHPESCFYTALSKGQWVPAELHYLDWLDKYLKNNGIENPELLNALHNRIWKYKHRTLFSLSVLRRKITRKILREARSILDKVTKNQNAL